MADLGCGTGVLSVVVSELGGFRGRIHAIDNNDQAIECTEMNMQVFGLKENCKTFNFDLD